MLLRCWDITVAPSLRSEREYGVIQHSNPWKWNEFCHLLFFFPVTSGHGDKGSTMWWAVGRVVEKLPTPCEVCFLDLEMKDNWWIWKMWKRIRTTKSSCKHGKQGSQLKLHKAILELIWDMCYTQSLPHLCGPFGALSTTERSLMAREGVCGPGLLC